jgi:hypothetical protein
MKQELNDGLIALATVIVNPKNAVIQQSKAKAVITLTKENPR